MISITKEEKKIINERFPNAYIVRTMKQKSKRHHYFCEESRPILNLLNKVRNGYSADNSPNRKSGYRASKRQYHRNPKSITMR